MKRVETGTIQPKFNKKKKKTNKQTNKKNKKKTIFFLHVQIDRKFQRKEIDLAVTPARNQIRLFLFFFSESQAKFPLAF